MPLTQVAGVCRRARSCSPMLPSRAGHHRRCTEDRQHNHLPGWLSGQPSGGNSGLEPRRRRKEIGDLGTSVATKSPYCGLGHRRTGGVQTTEHAAKSVACLRQSRTTEGVLGVGKCRDDRGYLRHGQDAPSCRLRQQGHSGFEHGQLSSDLGIDLDPLPLSPRRRCRRRLLYRRRSRGVREPAGSAPWGNCERLKPPGAIDRLEVGTLGVRSDQEHPCAVTTRHPSSMGGSHGGIRTHRHEGADDQYGEGDPVGTSIRSGQRCGS